MERVGDAGQSMDQYDFLGSMATPRRLCNVSNQDSESRGETDAVRGKGHDVYECRGPTILDT